MKFSKLLQMLLGIAGIFNMGIVPEGSGDNTPPEDDNTPPADDTPPEDDNTPPADDGKGKAKPTDAEAKLLKEVMDKKTALRKTQDELNEVKTKLKDFEGLDAGELRALLAEKKAAETAQLEAKGEWDRLKAQMADENKKSVDAVKAELEAERQRAGTLATQIAELTVGNSFVGSAFIKEELTLPPNKARALYGSHFEYADGKIVAYDKPAGAAERTMLVDAAGEPLAFDAALKKLVDADPDREQITRSKVKQGAGSKSAPKGEPPAKTFDEVKGVSRIAAALNAQKK